MSRLIWSRLIWSNVAPLAMTRFWTAGTFIERSVHTGHRSKSFSLWLFVIASKAKLSTMCHTAKPRVFFWIATPRASPVFGAGFQEALFLSGLLRSARNDA